MSYCVPRHALNQFKKQKTIVTIKKNIKKILTVTATIAVLIVGVCLLPAVAMAAEFVELGAFTRAQNISGDGNVVVGNFNLLQAVTWTDTGTLTYLGYLPGGSTSRAKAASLDGSVVVGESNSTEGWRAFRWTEAGGMISLGTLNLGSYSYAYDVSADGDVVVGRSLYDVSGTLTTEAFRWTEAGGMVGLGDLDGGDFYSMATAVSGDGTVIVGSSKTTTQVNVYEAFRWTEAGGMEGLGFVGTGSTSQAKGISEDGSTIVGSSDNGTQSQAFKWTEASGMVGLGAFSLTSTSTANDVSGDGSVVVGYARGNTSTGTVSDVAVRWADGETMQTISDWLADADITDGWNVLAFAYGISDDGSTVVGYGSNASGQVEAFLARVATEDPPAEDPPAEDPPAEDPPAEDPPAEDPDPGDGIIGLTDFTNSLGDTNRGLALGHKINGLMGNVVSSFASSSPGKVSDYLLGKSLISPVVLYGKGSQLMAAGVSVEHVRELAAIKASVARVEADDDGRYNGDVELSGFSVAVALDIHPGAVAEDSVIKPLNITIGLARGFYDGDFDRTYLNGVTPETSNGEPDVDTMSAFIKAGWDLSLTEKISLSPYVELAYQKTEMDSYTEVGGSFPGTVAAQDETNVKRSIGLEAAWQVNDSLSVGANVVVVNLHDDQGPDLTVDVPGVGVLGYQGVSYDDTWGELALNAQWGITSSIWLGGEIRGTTGSEYPEDYSARVELSYAF